MTAGVVMVLGKAGRNFGSGMTGGLAYMLEDAAAERTFNDEFVRVARIGEQEDEWLRMLLGEHLRLTGSPHAKKFLRSPVSLPLVRLEPLRLACSIEESWAPFLSRFDGVHRLAVKAAIAGEPEIARAAQ
jgi:hypothetical protein